MVLVTAGVTAEAVKAATSTADHKVVCKRIWQRIWGCQREVREYGTGIPNGHGPGALQRKRVLGKC